MEKPIKIIIVEDHTLFRLGIANTLKAEGDKFQIIGEAGSGEEFFNLLNDNKPDVVLLDIKLPDTTGIEIAKVLKHDMPEVKILVISAENDEDTITGIIETGVEGFISKNSQPSELITAIDYVVEGAEYFGKDISRIIRSIKVAKSTGSEQFTERENEIIQMCAQGYTAKEIADKLYINVATVNTHKNNIFKKIGINNSVELVRYALKHKLIQL